MVSVEARRRDNVDSFCNVSLVHPSIVVVHDICSFVSLLHYTVDSTILGSG
jgi:hypothetical protein